MLIVLLLVAMPVCLSSATFIFVEMLFEESLEADGARRAA
jgi:hypothetical protein